MNQLTICISYRYPRDPYLQLALISVEVLVDSLPFLGTFPMFIFSSQFLRV